MIGVAVFFVIMAVVVGGPVIAALKGWMPRS